MGVMDLLQEIAEYAQEYFFCHCERSEAISRKVVLIKRLPRSRYSLTPRVLLRIVCQQYSGRAMTFRTETLICEKSPTMIYPTHPPRLSGFDREAQPWRVFLCQKKIITQSKRLAA